MNNEAELEQFLEKKDKVVLYLDINGQDCETEPSISCGKHIVNNDTEKQRWYIKLCDGFLFHPNMGANKRSVNSELECSKEVYENYKKFLSNRKEALYNRTARMI